MSSGKNSSLTFCLDVIPAKAGHVRLRVESRHLRFRGDDALQKKA
jgi:hypothetical protein